MSTDRITEDYGRFREIIRGKIRKSLGRYMAFPDKIVRKGKDGEIVSIPFPKIDTPRFKFTEKQQGGIGQGDGEEGDPLSRPEKDDDGKAGDKEGKHLIEEFSIEEFIDIVAEELKLPNLDDSGKRRLIKIKDKYSEIRKVGPESLRSFKRTYKEALKRSIASGEHIIGKPPKNIVQKDKRYRASKPIKKEENDAVIFLIIDASGSMGETKKLLARLASFWIVRWIARNYEGVEIRFIIHCTTAREVEEKVFFTIREGGGTKISSAYILCSEIMKRDYSINETNVFIIQFSDGENWADDNELALKTIREQLMPFINMFGFVQVGSKKRGKGNFIITDFGNLLEEEIYFNLVDNFYEKFRVSEIKKRRGVLKVMKDLFGK